MIKFVRWMTLFAVLFVGQIAPFPVHASTLSSSEQTQIAQADAQENTETPKTQGTDHQTAKEYVLGTGDEIRLTVYGEDDLSGQYLIGSTGVVALPLIGNIPAANQTIHQFEDLVRAKLANGYLHDPRVSVQVSNYRPFFILGEVTKPGSYPYVNGMTILNAVALAGGYTYRANSSNVKIVHANDPAKEEQSAREDAVVMPGDIIRVPERFF